MNLNIYSTATETACELIQYINNVLMEDQNKVYNIAFSGGLTPALMYDLWANDFVDSTPWNRIHFWWVDEACVHPKSSDSNYWQMWNLLFNIAPVPQENIFRIKGENTQEYEAQRYSNLVKKLIPLKNDLPLFDIVLLDIGENGHVCSIYTENAELLNSPEIYQACTTPQGQKRVTLTGSSILNSKKIIFLVTGKRKASIIKKVLSSADSCPAAYIAHRGYNVSLYMDEFCCKHT